ncbi:MAG: hypothetical protein ACI4S3_10585, partial [Candidatus Gastranaerophilaceae bacterium]
MDNIASQSSGLYSLTSRVQKNTLLNRGILEIGGIAMPQVIMSNNKSEAVERAGLSGLFFTLSFLTPLVLIPFFNRMFLNKAGVVKDFVGVEKKILNVSKKYLTKDSETMLEGINKTGLALDSKNGQIVSTKHRDAFEDILSRFSDKEELRKKLLKVHKNVYTSDFLTSEWMLGIAPWLCMEYTERKTKKKGFSAAFNLQENNVDDKKYKSDKHKKMIANALVATIPAILAPRIIMKGIGGNHNALLKSNNIIKKNYGKFLNLIKNNADKFDYTDSVYMSKTIFALMWLLSDYPNCLICSRDKHERKDKAIRYGVMNIMFFGGDYLINNILGRLSDRFIGTKIMTVDSKKSGFFKRFLLPIKSIKDLEKNTGLTAKELNKTRKASAVIYWVSLFINMGLIGFGLPAFLNKVLRKDIAKEKLKNA